MLSVCECVRERAMCLQRKVNSAVVFSTEVHHGGKLTEKLTVKGKTDREREESKKRRGRTEAYIQNRRKDRGGHTKQRERMGE